MLTAGLILGGYGFALVYWPWVLPWTVAVLFGALGLALILSAVLAKGRRKADADPERPPHP